MFKEYDVDFVIFKDDGTAMTKEEYDKFLDAFIELVENHNMSCGGGITPIKDDDESS